MKIDHNKIESHIIVPTTEAVQTDKIQKARPNIVAARAARWARRAQGQPFFMASPC